MNDTVKIILARFLRGGSAAALSSMIVITPVGITTFKSLEPWLVSLLLAGIVGFVSGGIQALDKAYRMGNETPAA